MVLNTNSVLPLLVKALRIGYIVMYVLRELVYYGVHFNRFLLSQLRGLEVGVEWWTEKMDGTLVPTCSHS